MKELLEKIKFHRIHNILFSNIVMDNCGNFTHVCDIRKAFVFRDNGHIIIIYKVIERLLDIQYNRNIHDIVVQFFGTECLLHHIDYKGDLYHITIEQYEKISRTN